jgi:hypothetical protein
MTESASEQSGTRRTFKEHRSWGVLESVEEIVTDEHGRDIERTTRDPDGNVLNHVRYVRDADGRLVQEEWEEEKDGSIVRGRYVYGYDSDGKQVDRVWQRSE